MSVNDRMCVMVEIEGVDSLGLTAGDLERAVRESMERLCRQRSFGFDFQVKVVTDEKGCAGLPRRGRG